MFIVAGAVALGAVGVALLTTRIGGTPIESTAPVAVVERVSTSTLGDADEDGVPDWKELLWGTDPYNPDTDGDGISDGDEIAANVNPLKAGSEPLATNVYVAPKALTTSDAIARELFAQYSFLKEQEDFDPDSISGAIGDIIQRHTDENTASSAYTVSDIRIATSDNEAVRIAYINSVTSALLQTSTVPEYELQTVSALLETNDAAHVATLQNNARIYRAVVIQLLTVSTPAAYVDVHLEFVNALNALASAVSALSTSYTDPYDMLIAVDSFAAAEERVKNSFEDFTALDKTP